MMVAAFREAVKQTGRKRLIFGALYTEICLAYPIVEALADGDDVMFLVDAMGGLSQLAHATAIDRLAHAGAVPNTSLALVTELFRDWTSPLADKARVSSRRILLKRRRCNSQGRCAKVRRSLRRLSSIE